MFLPLATSQVVGQAGLGRDHVARRRAAEHRRRLAAAIGGEGGDAGDAVSASADRRDDNEGKATLHAQFPVMLRLSKKSSAGE